MYTEEQILQFLGFLTAEMPELAKVAVPALRECWEKFKAGLSNE